jgi:negative elongation factor C/D
LVSLALETGMSNNTNMQKTSQKLSNKSAADELDEVRKQLRQPDSIMQENILFVLRKFLSLGGTPQEVIKHLSENYRGYAQMCNLVCNWLRMTGVSEKTIQSLVEEHIKSLIIQIFDPRKADTIFDEGASAPEWLEYLIEHPDWRPVIYKLSEEHSDCLLLNYAIQRISDAGYQTEIATLTSSSTYFSVFNRVFKETLLKILDTSPTDPEPNFSDFKRMCSHSEHTYLYTQATLVLLSAHPNGQHMRRLSQELEKSVQDRGPIARKLSFMLTNITKYPDLLSSLSSILTANVANPADVAKLHTLYSQTLPPPVEYIRRPDLFELLIREMFDPSKSLDPLDNQHYAYVLAYATSVHDERSIISPDDVCEPKIDRDELHNTIDALETAQTICRKNYFGTELEAAAETLRELMQYPVVAMGVLHWVKLNLTDPNAGATSYNTKSTLIHLGLLQEISSLHVFQRIPVLDVLVASFEVEIDLDPLATLDLRKNILDTMIYVMECGCVIPVLNRIKRWTSKIDQSLLRHFVIKVLEMISPPFSNEFVHKFLDIINSLSPESLKLQETATLLASFCGTPRQFGSVFKTRH